MFEQLRGPVQDLSRHARIRRSGDKVQGVFVLLRGWAFSSVELPNGQRQILKVHLPGDILGAPSIVLPRAMETLSAATPVTVAPVPLSAFGVLQAEAPRLMASLFLSSQQERVMLSDRLAAVGRTPAAQRFAALLLQLHDRLAGPATGTVSLHVPLTQEDFADLLGITSVHVNRILRQLLSAGLIVRRQYDYTFDPERLREFSGMPRREWIRNPAWLHPAPGQA
ncbi:Crp/Fnr family transcriptional regulator [Sphingomonas sp. Sphisp140]|uniref:Crp/Fnr family transcriptional regulator n=1 Tax=unclassified Sphingomonas TaxID=196159 RepID=UPI0039AEF30F